MHGYFKLYSDFIHLQQFIYCYITAFDTVDIHSLSNDASTKRSSAWHSTVTMDQAIMFQELQLNPKQFAMQNVTKTVVKIRLPWDDGHFEYVSTLDNSNFSFETMFSKSFLLEIYSSI